MGNESMVVTGTPVRVTCNGRRYFSGEHREAVVAKCLRPGVSLAAVALANGLNANLLRKWVRRVQQRDGPASAPVLLPVMVKDAAAQSMPPLIAAEQSRCTVVADGTLRLRAGAVELQVQGVVDHAQLALVLDTMLARR